MDARIMPAQNPESDDAPLISREVVYNNPQGSDILLPKAGGGCFAAFQLLLVHGPGTASRGILHCAQQSWQEGQDEKTRPGRQPLRKAPVPGQAEHDLAVQATKA